MTEDPRYPEDFKGWVPLYPMHNNRFLVLESPDGTREACIHLVDNDVVGIKDKATGEDIYDGNLRLRRVEMKSDKLMVSLMVAIAFLLTFGVPWYYSILVHGFPYFVIAEPVPATWIAESFLLAFAIIYIAYTLIRLAKAK